MEKYSEHLFIAGLIVFFIPLLSFSSENDKVSYLFLLKNVTIPIYMVYYSVLWISLTYSIQNLKREVAITKNRLKRIGDRYNENITTEYKRLDKVENTLIKQERRLVVVNYTLRIITIITAIIIIIMTINDF